MPPLIIKVTLRPGYSFPEYVRAENPHQATRECVQRMFGPSLPGLFVMNAERFGIDPSTNIASIQVRFYEFGEDDVNVPDIGIEVGVGESQHGEPKGPAVVDVMFSELVRQFHLYKVAAPDNFTVELSGRPTQGQGSVKGKHIKW